MIAVICPGCQRKLAIKDTYAGKTGTCPHCKGRVKVPTSAAGENTNPSLSHPDVATVGASRPQWSPDEATLAPLAGGSPIITTTGERLDFLAPRRGPASSVGSVPIAC